MNATDVRFYILGHILKIFSLAFASMEISRRKDMKHLGKMLLRRKSFCIDETFFRVYNCLINTKKGELTKDEKTLQLIRRSRKKGDPPFHCHCCGGTSAYFLLGYLRAPGDAPSV
jgi:hypothetical protein